MEPSPVRITISEPKQTVSFLGDRQTAVHLVAACCADPENLEELLAACEIYQAGLAVDLMAALMAFDAEVARAGPGSLHSRIRKAQSAELPVVQAFQVVDALTEGEAFAVRNCELVHIDLPRCEIRTSPGVSIHPSAEVAVREPGAKSPRTVTYVLPRHWSLAPLGRVSGKSGVPDEGAPG